MEGIFYKKIIIINKGYILYFLKYKGYFLKNIYM